MSKSYPLLLRNGGEKMEIFYKDFVLGNFRASNYKLLSDCSFSYSGESEDEIGIGSTTIERFIGNNPVPIYLGDKYEEKLKPTIILIKNPCSNDNLTFDPIELRGILRELTGFKGYEWLRLINDSVKDELWYRAKVNNISYKRVGGNIVGIILSMECDSMFAWSSEYDVTINVKAGEPFYIFSNTDDLCNYVLPYVEIISVSDNTTISIKNVTDNDWISVINNVKSNEKITIDSQKEIISSDTEHNLLLDDFNLHFFRLIPNQNEYVSDTDITIRFKFRVPRKVGFV